MKSAGVRRPKDDDEVAVDLVVNGYPPYPVLSRADARRALIRLKKKDLSVPQMAERLHASPRTINYWLRDLREGKWKETE